MRLIDADELIVIEYGGIKFVPKEFIDDAPTVDAVPVVRCKDCKRFAPDKDGGDWGVCIDEGGMMLTQKDFGCLGGERKAEDATD